MFNHNHMSSIISAYLWLFEFYKQSACLDLGLLGWAWTEKHLTPFTCRPCGVCGFSLTLKIISKLMQYCALCFLKKSWMSLRSLCTHACFCYHENCHLHKWKKSNLSLGIPAFMTSKIPCTHVLSQCLCCYENCMTETGWHAYSTCQNWFLKYWY